MQKPSDDYGDRQRINLIVFAIAAVIVVATVALMLMLKHGVDLQDCFAAGHRHCAPIDESR
ncbi:MAG: hypothetical protein KGJ79_15910 [Alphaproteobacteria bacterium]|nr:hypothetical protein [Alphaproteobacteria bacterium]MDE2112627.1 hypothetical protein [Alphaproteobacteria bacterium]MDE2494464.1 hypothetical protein [Alphaproteobacteria bacterium]